MLDLSPLIRPRSVAVVGASDDRDTFGGRIWHYLRKYSDLNAMAVNTRPDAVKGVATARSLSELAETPDVVVLATPAPSVAALVSESVSLGARAAIVLSQVPPGSRLELGRLVEHSGLALLGPGSLGLINANDGVVLSSSVSLESAPRRGPLALVAQSGALMGVLHARAAEQGVGLGLCVATGSQLQVRVEHLLAALSAEGDYLTVGAHLEDVDAGLFAAAAESLRLAGRKLIVLKGGLTSSGAVAASGHSGALAGDGGAFRSFASELGVVLVSDPAELLACMQASLVNGRSWSFATVSGGLAAVTADIAVAAGVELAAPNPDLVVFPPGNERFEHANPLDIDAVPLTTEQTVAAVERLARDEGCDGVVLVLNDKPDLEGLLEGLALLGEGVKSRLHLCSECSGQYDHAWKPWVDQGGSFAKDVSRFLHGLASTREESPRARPGEAPAGHLVSDVAAQRLLADAGLPTLPLAEVWNADALEATISDLKLPLVLKLAGSAHRGPEGVVTVTSRPGARTEFDRLAQLGEVVAQPLAQPGLEFYVGINLDPVLGPVFLLGAGGPILEEHRDVAMTIGLPDRAGIRACLDRTRSGRWLTSTLASRLVYVELLVEVALRAVALAESMSDSLVALDLNPVVLGPEGAMVLDAKVYVRECADHDRRGAT